MNLSVVSNFLGSLQDLSPLITNKIYRDYLDQKGYPYVYVESDDGHIWRNWRIYLTQFTQLLFK